MMRLMVDLARFFASLIVASVVVFIVLRLVPGDPAEVALGVHASPELLEAKRAQLGTDRPLIAQYLEWIVGDSVG